MLPGVQRIYFSHNLDHCEDKPTLLSFHGVLRLVCHILNDLLNESICVIREVSDFRKYEKKLKYLSVAQTKLQNIQFI